MIQSSYSMWPTKNIRATSQPGYPALSGLCNQPLKNQLDYMELEMDQPAQAHCVLTSLPHARVIMAKLRIPVESLHALR